jgi:glycosyltransferase involved in cell wall biosynthesis
MFVSEHYLEEVARRGLTPPRPNQPPFHHWLAHGVAAGLSPTPGFDAEDYLALNADLVSYPETLFDHFIRFGQHEDRRFTRLTTIANSGLAALTGDTSTGVRRFCEAVAQAGGADGELTRMREFVTSGALEDLVRESAAIEPDIGRLEPGIFSMLAPWHDSAWADCAQFFRMLPEGPFDSVVLMPFCKLGGADFVAGVLTAALSETGRVLVIRTDADDWARPDWFPADVATVDLSGLFRPLSPDLRTRILYEILLRIRPGGVYNVNSRLAFDTFVRFGERLALSMRLCAYYFCADRTPEGIETGYPVWYFSNILPFLSAAMIDTRSLADRLVARYKLSGPYRDRVRVVYTPAVTAFPATTVAEAQRARSGQHRRKRILWGGRLDRQKRFDLVRQIARLLPEVDFDCWGKAVLDAPPDLSSLPSNLSVHPPFKTYDELPLADSNGWLYTSAWDGMPTILIELAALGVPMVASAVGGVPELIDETTGWPMDEDATAEDYAAAIEAMIASPDERVIRARALQDRARRQHSREAYAAAIASVARPLERAV